MRLKDLKNRMKKKALKQFERLVKAKMVAEEYRQVFYNPDLAKMYYDISDDELKEIFEEQASEHSKKPFNSPYFWAFAYWKGVEAEKKLDKYPKAIKKALQTAGSLFIKKVKEEGRDGV